MLEFLLLFGLAMVTSGKKTFNCKMRHLLAMEDIPVQSNMYGALDGAATCVMPNSSADALIRSDSYTAAVGSATHESNELLAISSYLPGNTKDQYLCHGKLWQQTFLLASRRVSQWSGQLE